ncbi:hypothetical protein Ritam007_61 [Mycobacterium phage Ritam007]|nr:hypothetical protein Saroj_61 [Mycobacterium phage Saroj]UZV39587.1 hypothetical protein Ritam007_61 [Mycobacterium phage Ritam007]
MQGFGQCLGCPHVMQDRPHDPQVVPLLILVPHNEQRFMMLAS